MPGARARRVMAESAVMMVVFLGPSLPLDAARTELDAVYAGPSRKAT